MSEARNWGRGVLSLELAVKNLAGGRRRCRRRRDRRPLWQPVGAAGGRGLLHRRHVGHGACRDRRPDYVHDRTAGGHRCRWDLVRHRAICFRVGDFRGATRLSAGSGDYGRQPRAVPGSIADAGTHRTRQPRWQVPLTSRYRERIPKDFQARLDDWRALLRRHVPQVRQILGKLLGDRVVFTSRIDHYASVGPWTLGKLVSGVVDHPRRMASPKGIALMRRQNFSEKHRLSSEGLYRPGIMMCAADVPACMIHEPLWL